MRRAAELGQAPDGQKPMAGSVQSRAEVLKLARLLRRDPATLAYLERPPAEDVQALREQVTDLLFDDQGPALSRLAAASKLLPLRVVAIIGQRAFGPLLAARITGLLEPERAAEMAATMPLGFLADVAGELDPRRAHAVIALIPPERIALIARELLRREEYVAMGRFVGHLEPAALRAAVAEMNDGQLLAVAFVLEVKGSLDAIVELLSPQRLGGVIDVAARQGMWVEVLDLLNRIGPDHRMRVIEQATAIAGEGTLEALVRVAVAQRLWGELLPLVPALPASARARIAAEVDRLGSSEREQLELEARAAGFGETVALLRSAAQHGA